MMPRFVVDRSWFRPRNRRLVIGGSPLRIFRLTAQGTAIADALERSSELPQNHEPLTSRLSDAGVIHPLPAELVAAHDITVVIPAFIRSEDEAHRLDHLVSSLAGHNVLVIDDASPLQFQVEGATVVRRPRNGGPAAARNSAMHAISTPYVAFIDDDVIISSETIRTAASHCAQGAALSAPRIRDESSRFAKARMISRYEAAKSPLDLGGFPARIQPLTRVSYVPAAALVMRTEIFKSTNGFDESMRVGEDVDLVWRLASAHQCRYEPTAVAYHHSRSTLRDFVRQRIGYGSSAAPLGIRHGVFVSAYSSNILLYAMCVLTVGGFFTAATVLALLNVLYVIQSLKRAGDNFLHALKMSLASVLHALRLFADALVRTWLFPYLALVAFIPVCRWILLSCFVIPGVAEWTKNRTVNPLTFLVLRAVDNISYCIGVWKGVFTHRSVRCLLPRITPLRLRAS